MSDYSAIRRAGSVPLKWTLLGILASFAAFNVLMSRLSGATTSLPVWIEVIFLGIWIFQPLLFGIWAALGPGWFVVRTSLAVPWLLILLAVPGMYPTETQRLQRYEFIGFVAACLAMFFLSTLLLLLLRRFWRWRIVAPGAITTEASKTQFDLKFLLALTTLCAIALGIMSTLEFKELDSGIVIFGPEAILQIIAIAGATFFCLLLPMMPVPLFTLSAHISRRAVVWSLVTWLGVTAVVAGFWMWAGEENMIPLVLLAQLGAAIVGCLAAFALRAVGYRLVRHRQSEGTGSA